MPHVPVDSLSATFARKRVTLQKCVEKEQAAETNVVVDGEEVQVPEFHVGSGSTHTTLKVNGRPPTMEVDMGASVSFISEATFKSIRKGVVTLELKESAARLQTYTGEQIKVCGSTVVLVEHND